MPWKQLDPLQLKPGKPPSFLPNNLVADKDGRLSFATGHQVQCTKRIFASPAHCDYTLAYSEKLPVTNTHWWSGLPRYPRALLVLTTAPCAATPATLQIWNTSRGTGTRIFRVPITAIEQPSDGRTPSAAPPAPPHFARGIAQVTRGPYGAPIVLAATNGALYGVHFARGRDGAFKAAAVTRDVVHGGTAMVAGDKRGSDYVAGADESGRLMVWRVGGEGRHGAGQGAVRYTAEVVYEWRSDEDVVSALGVRDGTVYAGTWSGYLTVHDVRQGRATATMVTNSKAVTCVEVYEEREMVVVCGEDGRVTVVGFSGRRAGKAVVHFSVALETIAMGCAVVCSPRGYPRMALLCWEGGRLLQYDYERGGRGLRGGGKAEWRDDTAGASGAGSVGEWVVAAVGDPPRLGGLQ